MVRKGRERDDFDTFLESANVTTLTDAVCAELEKDKSFAVVKAKT